MNSPPVSFAVCGFGRIGKRHAKIVYEFPGAELTAVIDVDKKQKEDLGRLGLDVPFYAGLDEFMDSDRQQTSVLNICVPNGLHAPLAIKALQNGYHIVVEKPMALRKSECEGIIQTSLDSGKKVFVVKQNRYSPTVKWLKRVVDEKKIGDIFLVQVNCFWNRDDRYYTPGDWHGTMELDGGTLFTQFSHFIDIMYWIFGDVKNISAEMENFNHPGTEFEDTGIVRFRFERGGMGGIHFTTSCRDQNMESSITVIGSKGSLKIGGQYMDQVEYCHIADYEMPGLPETNPPNDYGPYKGSAANHHYVIENVVDTLRGDGSISANAVEGMKVVDIVERIYHSARNVQ